MKDNLLDGIENNETENKKELTEKEKKEMYDILLSDDDNSDGVSISYDDFKTDDDLALYFETLIKVAREKESGIKSLPYVEEVVFILGTTRDILELRIGESDNERLKSAWNIYKEAINLKLMNAEAPTIRNKMLLDLYAEKEKNTYVPNLIIKFENNEQFEKILEGIKVKSDLMRKEIKALNKLEGKLD